MIVLNARALLNVVRALMVLQQGIKKEGEPRFPPANVEMERRFRDLESEVLDEVRSSLIEVRAPITLKAVDRLTEQLRQQTSMTFGELKDAANDIQGRLVDEVEAEFILRLEPREVALYQDGLGIFGKEVAIKFSTAVYEIDEATKCMAFDRWTAAVFHLMRVMELGIRAVSKCLGIPDPVKPSQRNWGVMLNAISDAIKKRGSTFATGDKAFFEGAHASLDAVRNAWRNTTMHVEKIYTEEEAEGILNAVQFFMKKLASRMDEDGQPVA